MVLRASVMSMRYAFRWPFSSRITMTFSLCPCMVMSPAIASASRMVRWSRFTSIRPGEFTSPSTLMPVLTNSTVTVGSFTRSRPISSPLMNPESSERDMPATFSSPRIGNCMVPSGLTV